MKGSVHPSNVIIQEFEITCMTNKFIIQLLGKLRFFTADFTGKLMNVPNSLHDNSLLFLKTHDTNIK
jgi:hypothetical protein